ncbi:thiamine pyrophosphate-binding protein [Streptomyces spiramenti]|uniref:Thiamine pyrophosphate-binding protein n=1 Tax=Streptomyces spiramenti TaxID=2720606 RepID=A0ABX1AM85_9ACTN|nr:thiamine pyrophosphate-binding protein [Streptomyces spiramenti]
MTTVAAAVARSLARAGVADAFGVVGGGNVEAVAAMTAAGLRYTAARHEAGAVAMADAYHRASDRVAVCTTSHGAGLTNALTPLAEAVRHGSGLVLVSGDAASEGRQHHDVDQRALLESLGVEVVLVGAGDASDAATDAVATATAERRPVAILIPAGVAGQATVATVAHRRTAVVHDPVTVRPTPAEAARLTGLLASASRPLLLAGLGAWRAGAGPALERLGERLGAVLATTVMGAGTFAGNPWSVGVCGGFSSPAAARLTAEADVVVAFGASLDRFTLHGGRALGRDATVVQVALTGGTAPAPAPRADLVVRADVAETVRAVDGLLGPLRAGAGGWRERIGRTRRRALAGGWHAESYTDRTGGGRVDPRTLTRELAPMLTPNRTVVWDGGHFIAWPAQYWSATDPQGLVFTGAAFQCVGLGLAGAVGAAAARPERTVVLATGDGGALMGLPELDTLVRSGASALVVVYDDAAYGFEDHMYVRRGADPATVRFADTDFAGVARSLGAEAVTVRSPAALAAVDRWRERGCRGTLLLDCKVVGGVVAPFLTELVRPGR